MLLKLRYISRQSTEPTGNLNDDEDVGMGGNLDEEVLEEIVSDPYS